MAYALFDGEVVGFCACPPCSEFGEGEEGAEEGDADGPFSAGFCGGFVGWFCLGEGVEGAEGGGAGVGEGVGVEGVFVVEAVHGREGGQRGACGGYCYLFGDIGVCIGARVEL